VYKVRVADVSGVVIRSLRIFDEPITVNVDFDFDHHDLGFENGWMVGKLEDNIISGDPALRDDYETDPNPTRGVLPLPNFFLVYTVSGLEGKRAPLSTLPDFKDYTLDWCATRACARRIIGVENGESYFVQIYLIPTAKGLEHVLQIWQKPNGVELLGK
jgi:hypothetical protein